MPGERGLADVARHQRVGRDAVLRPTLGGADGEEDVGALGLTVGGPRVVRTEQVVQVVEDDRGEQMADRGDGDDTSAVGRGQCTVQLPSEGEVPQVVRRELRLPALRPSGSGSAAPSRRRC